MTKDDIYEHLAHVYLGKKEKNKKRKKHPSKRKLFGQIVLTLLVLTSAFYGFTAFLSGRANYSKNNVIYSLSNNPLRITYDFHDPYPQIKRFLLPIPKTNAAKYKALSFSIRATDDGAPGIVKIMLKNKKDEASSYFLKDVDTKWQKVSIPFEEFSSITDWTNLTDVSFIFEAWNTKDKRGSVLVEDICFSQGG